MTTTRLLGFWLLVICPIYGFGQLKISQENYPLIPNYGVEQKKLIEFARINHFEYVLFRWHSPNWFGLKTDFDALIKQDKKWYLYKNRFWIRLTPDKQRNDTSMQVSKQLSRRERKAILSSLSIDKAFSITQEQKQAFEKCSCAKRQILNDGSVVITDDQPTDSGYDYLVEIRDGHVKELRFQLAEFKLEKCSCAPPALRVKDFLNTIHALYRIAQKDLPAFGDEK
ncbi:MAG: hypothetical protein INR69_18365 [Mucilaginibacter polytrichastri]|nr:hypothetical protein [Mucilaginibacter polytrichastri]